MDIDGLNPNFEADVDQESEKMLRLARIEQEKAKKEQGQTIDLAQAGDRVVSQIQRQLTMLGLQWNSRAIVIGYLDKR
jgi:hypothetical protein